MGTYMWALYAREVKRFQKLWLDTLFSPIVSMALYLSVFGIVVGSRSIEGVNFLTFVYSGLLAMIMVNSSFSNPAFSLIIAKNVGNIIDLQVAPLKPWQIGLAYSMAAFTRGLVTLAAAMLFTIWFIPGIGLHSVVYFVVALIITGIEFGLLGVVFGMFAKSFESLTFMTTFIMQPMIFLAGVFYPVAVLPGIWSKVSLFNPIFHNVELMRYSLTGYSDIAPYFSLLITLAFIVVLFISMFFVVRRGISNVSV